MECMKLKHEKLISLLTSQKLSELKQTNVEKDTSEAHQETVKLVIIPNVLNVKVLQILVPNVLILLNL